MESTIQTIKVINPFCVEAGRTYVAEIIDGCIAITKYNLFRGNNGIVFIDGEFKVL